MFTGLQAHASSDPWMGRNALDAHDPAVHLGRPVAPAAPPDARASTGSSRRAGRPPTSSRTGPSAWFMIRSDDQADYEAMRARFRDAVRGGRPRDRHDRRGRRSPVRATTMRNNRGPGRAVPGQHGRLRHRGPGRRPERRQHGHGQRQLGLPDDPPGPGDRAGGHARPLDPVPRRGRHAAGRRDDAAGGDARRPDGATTCSPTRRSSRPPGGSSAPD